MPIPGSHVVHQELVVALPGWNQVPLVNPTPEIHFLHPSGASPAGGDLELYVFGGGFIASSEIRWNGSARATTRISEGQLRCTVPVADLAAPGLVPVTVFSPAPGGGLSAAVNFTVQP